MEPEAIRSQVPRPFVERQDSDTQRGDCRMVRGLGAAG